MVRRVHSHRFHSRGIFVNCTCDDPCAPTITPDDVKRYRQLVAPHHAAGFFKPTGIVPIPGDGYIADLSHEEFHHWFGTECDHICPHRVDPLPVARTNRPGLLARIAAWFQR